MVIGEFTGEYRWLSNFYYPAPVTYEGMLFPTVEHAYQAAKTLNWNKREIIRKIRTGAEAKRAGRNVTLREDWNSIRLHVMRLLLDQKFSSEPYLSLLLATGEAEIVEGNWWNDTFWGVCRGVGENNLGRLIMEIRATLRAR